MSKLNQRQRDFVMAYAIPGTNTYNDITNSAIEAGYSEKTAYAQGRRLLQNVKVKKYLNRVQEELFDENIMSGKEVLYRLTNTARAEVHEVTPLIAKKAEYVEHPDTGNHNLVYNEYITKVSTPPKISDQNKALELLGKHHKLFTEKTEVEHSGGVTFNDDIK